MTGGTETWMLAMVAAGGALGLAVIAAALIGRSAEERDLSRRLRAVLRPVDQGVQPAGPRGASRLVQPLRQIGEAMRKAGVLVSEKDLAELQRAVAAAGFDPRSAVPAFVGVKAVLLVVLPLLALLYAGLQDADLLQIGLWIFGGLVLAIMGPNLLLSALRRPFENKLRQGLPDALDLLVVMADAGLGLETALDRVAREMAATNRPLALEFSLLVQELRIMPDRHSALERFAERSSTDAFRRLGGTLAQTLRYGTPLSRALRVLAAELRAERALRIEEKAVRLPALLIIPLILFIMPCVFIALVGPSVLELGNSLGANR